MTDPAVLIHGAWQGSWAFARFTPYLLDAGIEPHAIDLPGNGADGRDPAEVIFEDYLVHLRAVAAALNTPVSLVAHSGGSAVAIAFAERWPDQVARIVHIAGIMLPDGSRFIDLVKAARPTDPSAAGISPHLTWSPDRRTSSVPPDAAIAHFLQDVPRAEAEAAAALLTPHPEACRAATTPATAERHGRIPSLYVEALADRSIVPSLQRAMMARVPGLRRVALETGHAPQVSAPAALAAAIVPFLLGQHPDSRKPTA